MVAMTKAYWNFFVPTGTMVFTSLLETFRFRIQEAFQVQEHYHLHLLYFL